MASRSYESAASEARRAIPTDRGRGAPPVHDLVRYAGLAANSHNTQPWLFERRENGILIRPDTSRRCPAVDPDDHHLWASLGCAAENLVIAATAVGLEAVARFVDDGNPRIEIDLAPGDVARSPLIDAIPRRQSTRAVFSGLPLTDGEREALRAAAALPGVEMRLFQRGEEIAPIRELIIAGNTAQLADRAFVGELRSWIRFGERAALGPHDGLFSGCMGNPTIPDWLGRLVVPMVLRAGPENRKYREQIDSSAALAVFISDRERPANWVETGRAFQRFALEATRLGLAHAHVNQAVEVPEVRVRLARHLGLADQRPSLVIRVGRADPLPFSLRRPVDEILASA